MAKGWTVNNTQVDIVLKSEYCYDTLGDLVEESQWALCWTHYLLFCMKMLARDFLLKNHFKKTLYGDLFKKVENSKMQFFFKP